MFGRNIIMSMTGNRNCTKMRFKDLSIDKQCPYVQGLTQKL